jgi:hypothetical protein
MPDWEAIDPQLHEWTSEGVNPVEMCRRLGWDRKKRQTIMDRLRKLGLKEPAHSTPKTTQESPMADEPVDVLPGQIAIEAADTPVETSLLPVGNHVAVSEVDEPLSHAEVQTLQHYEEIITKGVKTFVEVGQALLAIRDQRLYRQEYSSFEDYLRQRWELSRSYAHELIEASVVVQNVSAIANIVPVNGAQARPLTTLQPEQQREVWREAVETAPPSGITAAHVKKTVNLAKKAKPTGTKAPEAKQTAPPLPKTAEQSAQEQYTHVEQAMKSLQTTIRLFREAGGFLTLMGVMNAYHQSRLLEKVSAGLRDLHAFHAQLEKTVIGTGEASGTDWMPVGAELLAMLKFLPEDNVRAWLRQVSHSVGHYAESLRDQKLKWHIQEARERLSRLIDAQIVAETSQTSAL